MSNYQYSDFASGTSHHSTSNRNFTGDYGFGSDSHSSNQKNSGFFCSICNFDCVDEQAYAKHERSMVHLRNINQPKTSIQPAPDRSRPDVAAVSSNQSSLYCGVCDMCFSQQMLYVAHINGIRHKENEAKLLELRQKLKSFKSEFSHLDSSSSDTDWRDSGPRASQMPPGPQRSDSYGSSAAHDLPYSQPDSLIGNQSLNSQQSGDPYGNYSRHNFLPEEGPYPSRSEGRPRLPPAQHDSHRPQPRFKDSAPRGRPPTHISDDQDSLPGEINPRKSDQSSKFLFYCDLCDAKMNTKEKYEEHMQGGRHSRKVKMLEDRDSVQQSQHQPPQHQGFRGRSHPEPPPARFGIPAPRVFPRPPAAAAIAARPEGLKPRIPSTGHQRYIFRCDLCDSHTYSKEKYEEHLRGSKHLKKVKKLEEMGSRWEAPDGPQPKNGQKSQVKDVLTQFLEDNPDESILGLNFITEFRFNDLRMESRFNCNLCEVRCSPATILTHIVGMKHRLLYMREFYMNYYTLASFGGEKRSDKNQLTKEYARVIAEKEGRKDWKIVYDSVNQDLEPVRKRPSSDPTEEPEAKRLKEDAQEATNNESSLKPEEEPTPEEQTNKPEVKTEDAAEEKKSKEKAEEQVEEMEADPEEKALDVKGEPAPNDSRSEKPDCPMPTRQQVRKYVMDFVVQSDSDARFALQMSNILTQALLKYETH